MRALVPMGAGALDQTPPAASATAGPRQALRPLVYPDRASPYGLESNVAALAAAAAEHERAARPPRWQAEARFRLSLGTRADDTRAASRRAVELAIVALGFCAAFGLREPARWLLRGGGVPATSKAPEIALPAARVVAAAAPLAPPRLDPVPPPRLDAVAVRARVAESARADSTTETTAAAAPPTARLESVLAIGAMIRATFRTDNDTVTVVPGEWIGGRLVVAIAADSVTLADRTGARHRIAVGQRTRFD
jgi:hypothetical protein